MAFDSLWPDAAPDALEQILEAPRAYTTWGDPVVYFHAKRPPDAQPLSHVHNLHKAIVAQKHFNDPGALSNE